MPAPEIIDTIAQYLALEPVVLVAKACCPFHDDRDGTLTVDYNRQDFSCSACGAKGDVVEFVALYEQISREQATSQLNER